MSFCMSAFSLYDRLRALTPFLGRPRSQAGEHLRHSPPSMPAGRPATQRRALATSPPRRDLAPAGEIVATLVRTSPEEPAPRLCQMHLRAESSPPLVRTRPGRAQGALRSPFHAHLAHAPLVHTRPGRAQGQALAAPGPVYEPMSGLARVYGPPTCCPVQEQAARVPSRFPSFVGGDAAGRGSSRAPLRASSVRGSG